MDHWGQLEQAVTKSNKAINTTQGLVYKFKGQSILMENDNIFYVSVKKREKILTFGNESKLLVGAEMEVVLDV